MRSPLRWASVLLVVFVWLMIHLPDDSLWYDETVNAYLATQSWSTIFEWSSEIDNQVPLHFWALKVWVGVAGDSEFALRLFSTFCALLAAAGVIALGKRLTGTAAGGGLAVLFFAGAGSFLYAGGEVRTYGLALALLSWSCVGLWSLWHRPTIGRHLLYLSITIPLLYTHYTAWLAIAAQGAFVSTQLLQTRLKQWPWAAAMGIGLLLGYVPWLAMLNGRDFNEGTAFAGQVAFADSFEAYTAFYTFGQHIPTPMAQNIATIVFVTALLAGMIGLVWGRRVSAWVLPMALTLLPLLGLMIAANQIEAKLAGRHAWAMWLGLSLLLAMGATALYHWLPLRAMRYGFVAIIGLGLGWLASIDLDDQSPGQFREAFAIMRQEAAPGDILLLQDGTLFTAAVYYQSPIPYSGIPTNKLTNVNHQVEFYEAMESVNRILTEATPGTTQRIWVLSWQGDTMDPTGLAFAIPEYLSDGQRTVWLDPGDTNDIRLVEYHVTTDKPTLLDHIVAYPGIIQVPPDGPSLLGYDVYHNRHEQCRVLVHTWWWRGDTDYPNTRVSLALETDEGTRIAQQDQPPAGYRFDQDHWTPFVPTLGRFDLAYPCTATGQVWLRVYDANGDKPTQPVLLGALP